MPRLAGLIAALLLALLPVMAAAGEFRAEATFVEGRPMTLPDGRPGEMRQVRDMGFLPGPDALLVLDSDSQLLAKSRQADAMTIVCGDAGGSCHGFDHGRGEVLLLDPAGFKTDGKTVPPITETDRAVIGPFGPSLQHWGFSARSATWSEHARAEWTHALRHPDVHVTSLLGGAMLILLLFVRVGPPRNRSWQRLTLWGISIVLRLIAAGYIVVILAAYLILGGFSPISLVICIMLGMALVSVPLLLLMQVMRKPAVAP